MFCENGNLPSSRVHRRVPCGLRRCELEGVVCNCGVLVHVLACLSVLTLGLQRIENTMVGTAVATIHVVTIKNRITIVMIAVITIAIVMNTVITIGVITKTITVILVIVVISIDYNYHYYHCNYYCHNCYQGDYNHYNH